MAYAPTIDYRTATGSVERKLVPRSGSTEMVSEDIGVDITAGALVSLSVQGTYYGDLSVECIILGSSGQEIAHNTVQGQKSTATCDGKAA